MDNYHCNMPLKIDSRVNVVRITLRRPRLIAWIHSTCGVSCSSFSLRDYSPHLLLSITSRRSQAMMAWHRREITAAAAFLGLRIHDRSRKNLRKIVIFSFNKSVFDRRAARRLRSILILLGGGSFFQNCGRALEDNELPLSVCRPVAIEERFLSHLGDSKSSFAPI